MMIFLHESVFLRDESPFFDDKAFFWFIGFIVYWFIRKKVSDKKTPKK